MTSQAGISSLMKMLIKFRLYPFSPLVPSTLIPSSELGLLKVPPGCITLYGQKRRGRHGKRAGIRVKTRQRDHPSKEIKTIVSARTPNCRQERDRFYIEVNVSNQKPPPYLARYDADRRPESSRLSPQTLPPVAYNTKKHFPNIPTF
ncbi:hypothetical protein QYM36_005868 [Artemia franciscana]|uniref:Uncharacterized protein n=1 Tax=Artemia franciscana TaxID=6661 RepID=A0AA88I251_ARTSF|nr:hypothetical protein QYM36_005868 [Artemia franciscana]